MATAASIAAHLSSKHLPPTQQWLDNFTSSVRASTPIQATHKTALFRITASDLTECVKPTPANTFPVSVTEANVQELRLPGPVAVQVLDIEDVGRSRWSQVEAIEAEERGETTRGREVIRVIPEENDEGVASGATGGGSTAHARSGPHKLLLQDAKGTKVYGFELTPTGVGINSAIGTKMVLKNTITVARGMVLLETDNTEILGGKVEAWDRKWREARKSTLKQQAGMRETA